MSTTQAWIDATRDMLLSGYVEELDVLTADVDAVQTTINVQGVASSWAKGVVFEVNSEMFYVMPVGQVVV